MVQPTKQRLLEIITANLPPTIHPMTIALVADQIYTEWLQPVLSMSCTAYRPCKEDACDKCKPKISK